MDRFVIRVIPPVFAFLAAACPASDGEDRPKPTGESQCRASWEAPGIGWRHTESQRDDHWGTAYTIEDGTRTRLVVGLGVGTRQFTATAKDYNGPGRYDATIATSKFDGTERRAYTTPDALEGHL